MSKLNLFGILKTIVPLGIGIYLIWFSFDQMPKETLDYFYKEIREANYFWIALSLVLSFIAYASRAYRWKYVLEPMGYKTTFWNRYHALMIGYIVNLTIPRAGEATRAAMLYRTEKVPFLKTIGSIIGERAVDLVMLASIVALTAFVGYDNLLTIFDQIKANFQGKTVGANSNFTVEDIIKVAIGFIVLVLVAVLIFSAKWRGKIISFIKDVLAGLLSIFKSKNPLAYIGHTVFIWFAYVLYFWIPFLSLEATSDFPLEGVLIGFIAGSVGITFTNGGLGVFPLLVSMVIVLFIGDKNPNALAIGNALGMIIWFSQFLLTVVLGLISLMMMPKKGAIEAEEEIEAVDPLAQN